MKWQTFLKVFAATIVMVQVDPAAASLSTGDFYKLVTQVDDASRTNFQAKYSDRLRQSINAAAIRHLERTCAQKHSGVSVQTFTLVGIMRQDGVLKDPAALPDNAFTQCVAGKMNLVTFPLPPGSGRGWPIAMQLDGKTGKVLYVAGDKQRALPHYSRRPSTTSMPWVYTPVLIVPESVHKPCELSVWVSVGEAGRVNDVDVADSSCPASVNKAVEDAAGQWLYMGPPGSQKVDTRDVRLSFSLDRNQRFRVKF